MKKNIITKWYLLLFRRKRIFLLGPSHHFYSQHCHRSPCAHYSTPLGDINLDEKIYGELEKTGKFPLMTLSEDEAEHSLELHLPYILSCLGSRRDSVTLVPLLVGALSEEEEEDYGQILAPYLADSENLFIISSDFCHWGSRFGYTFYRPEDESIHESIAWLDHLGMKVIEGMDPEKYYEYMRRFGNTICGRHPIGVMLQALKAKTSRRTDHSTNFTKYDRSSLVHTISDSSVSYAAAVVHTRVS